MVRIRQAEKELDLKALEERVQARWRERKIYEQSRAKAEGRPKYYFLDGPPYASGAIHLGTAWNKIIKDAIVRYLSMKGFNVRRQAGWDCHGLPIEVKVERKLGIKDKREIEALGVEKFVQECRRWATEHICTMTGQFQRLGIWLDWEEPYTTMRDEYIEAAWWTIKRAHEQGLLTQDYRVVTWCPRCETALADAEIEYAERRDPSIYVKFPVVGREGEYILIWTTTPWTLVGNLAVMVNPEFEYVRARTKEGTLILAKDLAPILQEKFGIEYEIIEALSGRELEGIRYRNPLSDLIAVEGGGKAYTVILSPFVALGEGTGCVHCAPGHGPEDFEASKGYSIKPVCPVDDGGTFTAEAGKYKGLKVKRDDEAIIEDLRTRRALLLAEEISHRYGHCWRCTTPIIYRATEQWFIRITELKARMLEEIQRVAWVPEWVGTARFKDWVENAKDWTISRQRYWGTPLPIWVCERCRSVEVLGTKAELERHGRVEELHRPYVDRITIPCPCGGTRRRVPDVLDVWFDSGVAAWASLGYPARKEGLERWYPVDFITEGHDQTRGWFYSQLGCGLLAFGEVPYRRVLMHGFTLDEKGEKMSKSLGNVVSPEEVIERYSAEALRFYTLWANKPWDDLRFNWEEVKVVQKTFTILWNVYVFATTYMAIDAFDPSKAGDLTKYYKEEDRWILSRLNSLIREVTEAFESCHPYRAARALNEFILEDLSRWYIILVRPRTWIEKESPEKLSAYAVLHQVLTRLSMVMGPMAPHITEEIYGNLEGTLESVHLEAWPQYDEGAIDKPLEEQMAAVRRFVEAVTAAREKKGIKRRWPVAKVTCLPNTDEAKGALKALRELFMRQANTLELEALGVGEVFGERELKLEPNLGRIGPDFKAKARAVVEQLKGLDPREVKERIGEGYRLKIDGEEVVIRGEHVVFKEVLPARYAEGECEFGRVYIDTEVTREILAQGYAREVVRRVQEMRKERQMEIEAFIEVWVEVEDKEVVALLQSQKDYIARETRTKNLRVGEGGGEGYTKTWEISGMPFRITLRGA